MGPSFAERLRGIIKGLPDIDSSIGVKVSETLVAGSEKLLVVVRYGHTSEQALLFAGDKARKALMKSVRMRFLMRLCTVSGPSRSCVWEQCVDFRTTRSVGVSYPNLNVSQ